MKSMPWRKLWRSTANDEKLRSMITRYGHEVSWIWTCLITQADDSGAVEAELEDLAYLTIMDARRLDELLGVFARKGLIDYHADNEAIPAPMVRITVTNWAEYQHAESESAERVRRYRERKREEAEADERYSNVTVTGKNSEGEGEGDTQEARVQEAEKAYPENPEGPFVPDEVPMARSRPLPQIHWPTLLELWEKVPGAPSPGGLYRLTAAHGRELLQAFVDLDPEDIYQALRNYAQVRSTPGTWWSTNPEIVPWARKNIGKFLPCNFRLEAFIPQTREAAAPARPGPLDDRPDAWDARDVERLQEERAARGDADPIDLQGEFRKRIGAASA